MVDTDAIMSGLREQGVRVTTVRRAVIVTLAADHSHQSADDLAAAVQIDHPDIHRSTIYRTLDSLEKLGVVDHVHLGHGPRCTTCPRSRITTWCARCAVA